MFIEIFCSSLLGVGCSSSTLLLFIRYKASHANVVDRPSTWCRKAWNPETEKPAGSPQKNCPAKSSLMESPPCHFARKQGRLHDFAWSSHSDPKAPRLTPATPVSQPASLHSGPLSFYLSICCSFVAAPCAWRAIAHDRSGCFSSAAGPSPRPRLAHERWFLDCPSSRKNSSASTSFSLSSQISLFAPCRNSPRWLQMARRRALRHQMFWEPS